MKVTISESTQKEIELPLYFRLNRFPHVSCMTVGEKSVVMVKDNDFNESLTSYPQIDITGVRFCGGFFTEGIAPISETEFKTVFLKVSLAIEKLCN